MKFEKVIYDLHKAINNSKAKIRSSLSYIVDSNFDRNIKNCNSREEFESRVKKISDGIFIGRDSVIYDDIMKFIEDYGNESITLVPINEEAKHIQENNNWDSIIMKLDRNNKPIYYEKDEYGKLRKVSKKYAELKGFKVN